VYLPTKTGGDLPAALRVFHAVATRRRASIHWARLLARIYELRPLTCPRCHGEMRLIAILTEPPSIRAILAHLCEPTTPPVLAPRARAPPELEAAGVGQCDLAGCHLRHPNGLMRLPGRISPQDAGRHVARCD
jgi:hypothetical protein